MGMQKPGTGESRSRDASRPGVTAEGTTASCVAGVAKPCLVLSYCPYGVLVEQFPVADDNIQEDLQCRRYGHACPVFEVAEAGDEESAGARPALEDAAISQ